MLRRDELVRPVLDRDAALLRKAEEVIDGLLKERFDKGDSILTLHGRSAPLLQPLWVGGFPQVKSLDDVHMEELCRRYRDGGWDVTCGFRWCGGRQTGEKELEFRLR